MSRHHVSPELTDAYREECYKLNQCPHCGVQDQIAATQDRKKLSQHMHVVTRYECEACGASGTFSERVEINVADN